MAGPACLVRFVPLYVICSGSYQICCRTHHIPNCIIPIYILCIIYHIYALKYAFWPMAIDIISCDGAHRQPQSHFPQILFNASRTNWRAPSHECISLIALLVIFHSLISQIRIPLAIAFANQIKATTKFNTIEQSVQLDLLFSFFYCCLQSQKYPTNSFKFETKVQFSLA